MRTFFWRRVWRLLAAAMAANFWKSSHWLVWLGCIYLSERPARGRPWRSVAISNHKWRQTPALALPLSPTSSARPATVALCSTKWLLEASDLQIAHERDTLLLEPREVAVFHIFFANGWLDHHRVTGWALLRPPHSPCILALVHHSHPEDWRTALEQRHPQPAAEGGGHCHRVLQAILLQVGPHTVHTNTRTLSLSLSQPHPVPNYRNALTDIDPVLLLETCLYLAIKVEECGPVYVKDVNDDKFKQSRSLEKGSLSLSLSLPLFFFFSASHCFEFIFGCVRL